MSAPLSPLDAVSLVQLRALLDHAQQVSRTVSLVNKAIATVLLDAVNERAMRIVATSRGVALGYNETFDGVKVKVQAELGQAWNVETANWREVRRLHNARNGVQHLGSGVDRDEIPGWRAATLRFTAGLIQAVFGISINQVMYAAAISDAGLRTHMVDAERHLEAGDASASFRASRRAYDTAKAAWQKIGVRSDSVWPREPSRHEIGDHKLFEYLKALAQSTKVTQEDQVFATTPAEAAWFAQITTQSPEHVNLDEAQRALSYVFWWIVEWEAVRDSFVPDRRVRWAREQRRRRSGDAPIRIAEAGLMRQTVSGHPAPRHSWIVTFTLTNLPPEDAYGPWVRALKKLMAGSECCRRGHLTETGDVEITVDELGDFDTRRLVEELDSLLGQALAKADEPANAEAEQRARQDSEIEAFREQVEARRDELPSWIRGAELKYSQRGLPAGMELIVDLAAMRPAIDLLRAHPDVRGCYPGLPAYNLQIRRLDMDKLVSVVQDIDGQVRERIEAARVEQAEYRAMRDHIQARLRHAINEVRGA